MKLGNKIPVFTYWENPLGKSMPTFIQLCLRSFENNLEDPFKFILITPANLEDYLDDLPDNIWKIYPNVLGRSFNKEVRTIALRSGIIRWGLLAKHGGFWIDADTFVFENFKKAKKHVKQVDFAAQWSNEGWPVNSFMFSQKNGIITTDCWVKAKNILECDTGLNWGQAGFRLGKRVVMANPEIPVFKIKEKHVCYLTNSERESDLVNLQELPESLWLLSLNASSFTAQIRKKSESEIRENKVWNDLLIKARV